MVLLNNETGEKMNIYEIYMLDGSLLWVWCKNRQILKTLPDFDEVITCNDATRYGVETAITWEG